MIFNTVIFHFSTHVLSDINLFREKKYNGFSAWTLKVVAGCSIDKSRLASTSHTPILKVILEWKMCR